MKKLILLISLFVLNFAALAQNCNFNATPNGIVNAYTFTPNSNFSPNIYHFVWDFGDGTTSTSISPTHVFNTAPPYVVCYTIYDSANVPVCSACDTLYVHGPVNCSFTTTVGAGLVVTGSAQASSGNSVIHWDMGDGSAAIQGTSVSYTYAASGTYSICIYEIESGTGDTLCHSCDWVTVSSTTTSCSFTAAVNPNSLAVTFIANTGGLFSSVTWDFGDGTTGSGAQATHTYANPGTYNVCMTVVSPTGAVCNYCHPVVTNNSHGNCFYSYVPTSTPNTYTFTAQPTSPSSIITWDFDDGTTATGATVTHTFANAGTYNVCMIETDQNQNTICSFCQHVQVGTSSHCNFTSSVSPLHPLSATFTVNNTSGSVSWDFGDGTTDTGAVVTHTYASAGTYNVCITVTGSGLVCTTCQLVTVGSNTSTCAISYYPDPTGTNAYVFNYQPASTGSYILWDFGDGTLDTGASVHHSFLTAGTYLVCVIERDANQLILCQTCVTITIGGGPANTCQASFIATSLGLTAYFVDLSLINAFATQYSWDFGDGTTSNVRFPQHIYAAPGTYNVCLTIVSGNCTDTYCTAVIVDTTVNPSGVCLAFFAVLQLAPYQVSVVNLSSGVNLNFTWDFGDGTTATGPYPTHVYTTTGSYNLCLTVSDANGCTDTYCDTLSVDTLGNIFRVGAQGFSINVISPEHITGIGEVRPSSIFSVYPNPVSSVLKVELQSGSERAVGYKIYSLQGSEVLSGTLDGFEAKINMHEISTGTYIFEIDLADGSRSYHSIVKY